MKRFTVIIVSSVLFMAGMALAAQKPPSLPSPKEKCPVCGMFVAKYPDWTASITYRDGTTLYFDGPKDLFTYYLNPAKYDPARKRADITAVVVKDYYSLAFIDGKRAFYVTGSDVFGPMGKELIPLSTKADADSFLRDHQGKGIFRFGDVTVQILKGLE